MKGERVKIAEHPYHTLIAIGSYGLANGFLLGPTQVLDHALIDHNCFRSIRREIPGKSPSFHHFNPKCFDEFIAHKEGGVPERFVIEHPLDCKTAGVVIGTQDVLHPRDIYDIRVLLEVLCKGLKVHSQVKLCR